VIDKTARILFKSLGGILAIQERLAERWLAAREKAASPPPPDAPPADAPGVESPVAEPRAEAEPRP
jgi:hypothetical protein